MRTLHTDKKEEQKPAVEFPKMDEQVIDKTKEQEIVKGKSNNNTMWLILGIIILVAVLVLMNYLNKNKDEHSQQ
jgi:sensor c-di-GMP phosphodiesterase-like protein